MRHIPIEPSGLSGKLRPCWRTEFPLNFRTLVFCFLVGSLLSVPCGFFVVVLWELYDPPLWTGPIYISVTVASLLVLPFWSGFALRGQPILRWIGFVVSFAAFILIVLAFVFPSLNTIKM